MDRISMITALFSRALVLKSIGGDSLKYIGVTTTALSDGATTNPITIDGDTVTATNGNVALYGGDAFVFNGTIWQASSAISQIFTEIGDLSDLDTEAKTDLVSAINEVNEEKQDDVELSLTPTAVVSDRDIQDGQGNTLSVLAEALTKTASGNPVVISDCAGGKARSLVTTIEAIQDLHGYDKPWTGGAGKNKIANDLESTTDGGITVTKNSDGTYTFNGTATRNIDFYFNLNHRNLPAGNYIFSGITGGSSESDTYRLYLSTGSGYPSLINGEIYVTISEQAVAFLRIYSNVTVNNLVAKPMLRLATETDPTFAPYSNICPISGYDSVSVDVHGRNMWDEEWVLGDINGSTGAEQTSNDYIRSGFIKVNPSESYYLRTPTTIRKWCYFYDANKTYLGQNTILRGNTNIGFALPTNAHYMRFLLSVSDYGSSYKNDVCLNVSDADFNGQYVPYVGADIAEIPFPSTIYGGTLDVKTGVLTVDRAIHNVTWGDGTGVTILGSNTRKRLPDLPNVPTNIQTSTISNIAPYLQNWESDTPHFYIQANKQNYAFLPNDTSADTQIQICYKLATPTTIQLTPTQLQMLKGYNRVTIESGTITLDYLAKTDNIQAEVDVLETSKADNADVVDYIENGNTASRAYTANQFMLWKGDLYKVTTSIASGATITAGTNVSKTTIGAVLTTLLNA